MGAIDFPSNPTDQQVFSSGGVTYIYNASIGAWLTSYVSTPLYTSANTQVLYNDDGQSKGNTGLVFDRRANTLIVNNIVAAGSNVASVINSAFGRANTALQNTSGTFSGTLSVTANVGIGVSSPAYRIHVVKSDPSSLGPIARLYHGPNSDRSLEIGTTTAANYLSYIQAREAGNNPYDLALNPENGNVGIGTTQPSYKLQVGTGSAAANNYAWFNGNVGTGSAPTASFGLLIGTNYSGGASETNIIWGQGIGPGQYFAIGKTTGSAYTEQMRINSSGHVTTPAQPAFRAYSPPSGNYTTVLGGVIPLTGGTRFNIGNHFNTSTSRFTAPIAGIYLFCFVAYNNGSSGERITIRVNGSSAMGQGSRNGSSNDWEQTAIFQLSAGDYVDVRSSYGGGTVYLSADHTELAGFLIG